MKHLFFVRHGDYQTDGEALTEVGRGQIRSVGEQIKSILAAAQINADKIFLMSSHVRRAEESAKIIQEMLEVESLRQSTLLCVNDFSQYESFFAGVEFHPEHEFQAIILVGHAEMLQFGREYHNVKNFAGNAFNAYEKGDAMHFDLEKTVGTALKPKII